MTSLTQLCRDLSIGKPRLYGLLDRLDIKPEQVGNKRLLDNEQVSRIREALRSQTDRKPTETVQDRPQTDRKPDEHTSGKESRDELIATLRDQVAHLKALLTNEQSERQEERQERSNYQQILMLVQKEVQGLRQENNQLKLEHQPPVHTAEPAQSFEEAEESVETVVDRVDPLVATHTKSL